MRPTFGTCRSFPTVTDRLVDRTGGSAMARYLARIAEVQSIEVVNRYLLRITLKEPSAPFMVHLAQASYMVILPREVEEKHKDFNRPEAMIGSGPFMLKSYQKGSQIVFERNPDY